MTTYSSLEDGSIAPEELPYYHRRAEAGFGIVMTAACYVHKTGHAFPGQWACDDDRHLPSLRSVAEAIRAGGAKSVLQIHHGGRQCPSRLSGVVLSASAIPSERPTAEVPEPMTVQEIDTIVDSFAQATRRAHASGFDGVEIHGANTYLLQQFVSPHSNRREDAYGQDRLLFSRRIVEACLAAVPSGFPIGYRFSPEEREDPGIRWADTARLLDLLCGYPLAFLHISLGDYRQSSLNGEWEGSTMERVLGHIAGRLPLIGVGSVRTRDDVEAVLATGCSGVAVGRAAIIEPDWPRKVRVKGEVRTRYPRENAIDLCVLPAGLNGRILGAPGWFEMED